jgi:hypothetical protein
MNGTWMRYLVAAVVGGLLVATVSGKLAVVLPLLLALACPLMMIFMMKGMHGGGSTHDLDRHDQPTHRSTG